MDLTVYNYSTSFLVFLSFISRAFSSFTKGFANMKVVRGQVSVEAFGLGRKNKATWQATKPVKCTKNAKIFYSIASCSRHVFLLLCFRSRSPYVQVIGQISSVQSSCHTPTIRKSSPALETASSTTPTQRRVPSTTDSASSPAIMELLMRCWFPEADEKRLSRTLLSSKLLLCFVRLWRYRTTLTLSCHAGRTARCDGLTSARKLAALKKTAKMYGDVYGVCLLSVRVRISGSVSVAVGIDWRITFCCGNLGGLPLTLSSVKCVVL